MNDRTEQRRVFDLLAREIRDLAWEIHERRNGEETPEELFQLYLGMIEAVRDRLLQQERSLKFMLGHEVEPMTHYAKVVVQGVVGQ